MPSIWSYMTRRLQPDEPARPEFGELPKQADVSRQPSRLLSGPPALDAIGQRNELLKVRFSQLGERLDDLKTLAEDFAHLVDPVEEIVTELPKAKGRILEIEALLSQEMETSQFLRREVDGLSDRLSTGLSELATSKGRAIALEQTLKERDSSAEETRLLLRERSLLIETLERQIAAERDAREQIDGEFQALSADFQTAEHALSRSERSFATLTEQHGVVDQENVRLQRLVEEQLGRLLDLESRAHEQEQAGDTYRQEIAGLQAQIAAEQSARRKSEEFYDSELSSLTSERASLSLKLDSASARLAAGEQILAQVRRQLQDKDETLRATQKAAKDALSERATFDRRLEAARADLEVHVGQLQDARRLASEFEDRADMLAKALSAKDAQFDGANGRIASLQDRVEGLTRRFEQDRMALEAINRRLIEELQNEKAERAMAQGALDIARESRFSLQRQNVSLKRAVRGIGGTETENAPENGSSAGGREEMRPSNVAPFTAPDRRD